MNDAPVSHDEPVLRTLEPALRELERRLRTWLQESHRFPLSTLQRATLEGFSNDLHRQAEALNLDRPLLVIVFMGGTGVGKSTLLNALAGGAIAQASFARPTTRDPVVYFHESIKPERLDPALRLCKLASHDRPFLQQKILVDTPDLDSNDLSNREKLFRILTVADVVLYVGSQEKYHDQLGWELFLQQRQRRAFAFVLNKWDRCQAPTTTGLRPDQDLLQDLNREGFQHPVLFRTTAQHWVDHPWLNNPNPVPPPVEGEEFLKLVHWLEQGLNRLEIESIKARGISQLLRQLIHALDQAKAPDLVQLAEKTKKAWQRLLEDEAAENAVVLLNTLEPYQRDIEHYFALERQRQFRGLMATYLYYFNKFKYTGSSIRLNIPFMPRLGSSGPKEPKVLDMGEFSQAFTKAAADQHLEARTRALANRLIVEADRLGYPVPLLSEPTDFVGSQDWRNRYTHALVQVLSQVEHVWSNPQGIRRVVQSTIVFLADWLPILAGGTMVTLLLWDYTMAEPRRMFNFTDLILPAVVMVLVVMVLHFLIALFLPLRWQAIRNEFENQLRDHLVNELQAGYADLPVELAQVLLQERKQVEAFTHEIQEVANWLEQRENAGSIEALYGK